LKKEDKTNSLLDKSQKDKLTRKRSKSKDFDNKSTNSAKSFSKNKRNSYNSFIERNDFKKNKVISTDMFEKINETKEIDVKNFNAEDDDEFEEIMDFEYFVKEYRNQTKRVDKLYKKQIEINQKKCLKAFNDVTNRNLKRVKKFK